MAFGATEKVSQLPATSTLSTNSLIVVDSLSGATYTTKTITLSNWNETVKAVQRESGRATNLNISTGTNAVITYTNDLVSTPPIGECNINLGLGSSWAWNIGSSPGGAQYGQMFINTTHSGDHSVQPNNTEWQFTAPENIAICPGYFALGSVGGHIQLGIGKASSTNLPYWAYWQNEVDLSTAPMGFSGAQCFRTAAKIGANGADFMPGIFSRYTSTNGPSGTYELVLFPSLGNNDGLTSWTDSWNASTPDFVHSLFLRGGNSFNFFCAPEARFGGNVFCTNDVYSAASIHCGSDLSVTNSVFIGDLAGPSITLSHLLTGAARIWAGNGPSGIDADFLLQDGAGHTYCRFGTQNGGNFFNLTGLMVGAASQAVNGTFEVTGTAYISGAATIGGGTAIQKVLSATAALDFASTAANTSTDLPVACTGAIVGDVASVGVPVAVVTNNVCFTAYVASNDWVNVRLNNYGSSAKDVPSATFRVQVTHF